MTFYSFPTTNAPHSKAHRGVAKADQIAAGSAVILYFVAALYFLPGSEYLHALGGGALTFGAVVLASAVFKRGWLPGLSVLAVGFISFAILVMPTLPAMGGTVMTAIPIGFIGVQAAILLWAVLQWPYTLPTRSHLSFVSALQYGLVAAAIVSAVATIPIVLMFLSAGPAPKAILLVYPAYFAGFLSGAIIYWSLQRFTYLAVGRYLIGFLAGACVYGAVGPVVSLFRNEPIEAPLLISMAAICGGFVGPALMLNSKEPRSVVAETPRYWVLGARQGVLLGVVFSLVLGTAMLIRGPEIYGETTFLRTISITIVFGLLGGLCVGALGSFATRNWEAMIIGAVGGIFAFAAIFFAIFGWERSMIRPILVGGILIGSRAGAMLWRKRQPGLPG
jgi:hypothetical protein